MSDCMPIFRVKYPNSDPLDFSRKPFINTPELNLNLSIIIEIFEKSKPDSFLCYYKPNTNVGEMGQPLHTLVILVSFVGNEQGYWIT